MYVARSEKRIFVTCLTRLENVHREEKRKMYHILVVEDDKAILDGVGIDTREASGKVRFSGDHAVGKVGGGR